MPVSGPTCAYVRSPLVVSPLCFFTDQVLDTIFPATINPAVAVVFSGLFFISSALGRLSRLRYTFQVVHGRQVSIFTRAGLRFSLSIRHPGAG